MYYYIMEPKGGKFASRQEKIKDILGNLGIAGETVSPSPARTIEELTHLGIVKGYSTIVAVGSDSLVNKIITAILQEKNDGDIVLGIIPDDFTSPIAKITGAHELHQACEILKLRRLTQIDVCMIEPNKYFVTEAVIENPRNSEVFFVIDKVQGSALTDHISITPGINLQMHDKNLEGSSPIRFYNWLFGKKRDDIFSSTFSAKRLRIELENHNLSIKVSGETIAKTPATFHNKPKLLKIIVARDNIKQGKVN